MLEQLAAQRLLVELEAARDAGQVPDRLDGGLDAGDDAALAQDRAVRGEPPLAQRLDDLGHARLEARDGDGGLHAHAASARGGGERRVGRRHHRAPRVERDDGVRVVPRGVRPDGDDGLGACSQPRP